LVNNDEYAIRAVKWVADMCKNSRLNWGIETVIKWLPEFMTKYPIPDNTPKDVKNLIDNLAVGLQMPLNRAKQPQISTNEVKNEPNER
jgi:hypothetical protein